MEIKLLVVEDDEDNINNYKRCIGSYNEDVDDVKIVPHFKRNLEEGLEALKSNSYDAAIVDIKLSPDDMEGRGNQILKEIKSNLRFPVFVITGYPQDIEDEFIEEENIFWRTYRRDEADIPNVFDKIAKIVKTGVVNILGNKGYIEEYLKKIFWEHIAKDFEEIVRFSPEDNIERVLIRYVSTHLMEYLDVKSNPDTLYIPAEFYIRPPVRSEYFTGDILKDRSNNEFLVILTPPCDMIKRTDGTRNAERFLCAKIREWNEVNESFREITRSTGRHNPRRRDLENYVNNKKDRYHFIPLYRDIPAGFIDFQILKSLSEDEIKDRYDRVATISPLFMRDIIARFSRYYARQGQPDLDIEKILQEMLPDDNPG